MNRELSEKSDPSERITQVPILSIITVCFNAEMSIEKTIRSVTEQTDSRFEYIVIDGDSHDGTKGIIEKYLDRINCFVSNQDQGIYDAMNHGIALAHGSWLIFLNAGDTFTDQDLVRNMIERHLAHGTADFYYSDVCLVDDRGRKMIHHCDHHRMNINHQCAIYRRVLHEQYGMYFVAPKVTISDYLFFCLIPPESFVKVDQVIANYETTGVSQGLRTVEQKFTVDFLLGRINKTSFILHIILYDYYRRFRQYWRRQLN